MWCLSFCFFSHNTVSTVWPEPASSSHKRERRPEETGGANGGWSQKVSHMLHRDLGSLNDSHSYDLDHNAYFCCQVLFINTNIGHYTIIILHIDTWVRIRGFYLCIYLIHLSDPSISVSIWSIYLCIYLIYHSSYSCPCVLYILEH